MTQESHSRTQNPQGGRRVLRIVLVCFLMLLFAHIGTMVWRVNQLRRTVSSAAALSLDDLGRVGPLADQAMGDLESVYRGLRPVLWVAGYCGWVPEIGPLLAIAPEAGENAMVLVRSGYGAYGILRPWLESSLDLAHLDALDVGALIETATSHRQALDDYAANGRAAADAICEIALDDPPDSLLIAQAGARYAALGLEGLALLPDLAGPEERTYLLLAQNNQELRATGGFISAMGSITVGPGGLRFSPFEDSYKVENWHAPHPDPPEALREHMFIDLWTTRDGNWWPDFPTSAKAVADLYELNQDVVADGVIAADLHAAQVLLEAMTPLTLASGRVVQSGEVQRLFTESWGLDTDRLRTDGVAITTTRPFVAVEIGLEFPATKGQVWFDDIKIALEGGSPIEHLTNPSLELDADGNRLPDGWETEGLGPEDGLDPKSLDGAYSLTLIGDETTPKRVWQTLDVSGEAGSVWRVSSQSAAHGVPGGQSGYAMTVSFIGADGTSERHRASFPAFTHDWATAGSDVILGDWWRHRKDIIGDVMAAAATKGLSGDQQVNWPRLGIEALRMLDEKHIQAAFFADAPAAWMAGYGWDGALRQTEPDFLMVVDSNVGFNKVTASVEQSLVYTVTLEETGRPVSEVELTYVNKSPATLAECDKGTQYVPTYELLTQGCYWDYVRVYAPLGANLIETRTSQQPVEQYIEGGFTVFSTALLVPPGETARLCFSYEQPSIRSEYGLNLVKQAGALGIDTEVRLMRQGDAQTLVWRSSRVAASKATPVNRTLVQVDTVIREALVEAYLGIP